MVFNCKKKIKEVEVEASSFSYYRNLHIPHNVRSILRMPGNIIRISILMLQNSHDS